MPANSPTLSTPDEIERIQRGIQPALGIKITHTINGSETTLAELVGHEDSTIVIFRRNFACIAGRKREVEYKQVHDGKVVDARGRPIKVIHVISQIKRETAQESLKRYEEKRGEPYPAELYVDTDRKVFKGLKLKAGHTFGSRAIWKPIFMMCRDERGRVGRLGRMAIDHASEFWEFNTDRSPSGCLNKVWDCIKYISRNVFSWRNEQMGATIVFKGGEVKFFEVEEHAADHPKHTDVLDAAGVPSGHIAEFDPLKKLLDEDEATVRCCDRS